MRKSERLVKLLGTILCEVFAILTIIYLFTDGEADRLALAFGTMLGHCWKLYYTVPVWDKVLHICGGVMFAILWLDKGKHPLSKINNP